MDESKLAEFMGRLVADMGGAAMVASIIVGEELGLYRAMADGQPVTPDELAARTECQPRLVLEWLNAQVASGYVEFVGGAYRLPHAELHAVVLPHAVHFVAPAARPQLARLAGSLEVDDAAGGIWDLGRELGAPASLAELGLAEAELDRAAAQAVGRVVQTPRRAGVSELRALLEAAWQGGRPPPA